MHAHTHHISRMLIPSTQPLICSRMSSNPEKQWHFMEQLKRWEKELQSVLRHILQMQCTEIHLPALTFQLLILVKWNHALKRRMPACTSRPQSPDTFFYRRRQEKPLCTQDLLSWATLAFYFTNACGLQGSLTSSHWLPKSQCPSKYLECIQGNTSK